MTTQKSIIRTTYAGVFFGIVEKQENTPAGVIAEIRDCRRLWYWNGAASLSQLAQEGVKKPGDCKFTVTVPSMEVMGVIEIIPCTEAAVKSIDAVAVWRV